MITLISYASDNMTISQERLVVSAYKYGIENVISYGRKDIDENFYLSNKEILDAERGAGYWLWKPYIINKTIQKLNEGILVYCDAGLSLINDPELVIEKMGEDIFFFTNGFPQVEWCKADVYHGILSPESSLNGDYWSAYHKQVQASVIFFKVNDSTKQFVKEWLLYSQMPGYIDDSPSELPNYPTFAEHRHDQAILTCLQIKYGYKLHFWPTIYSEHIRKGYEDGYPAMFDHHRKRNHEWQTEYA